MTTVAPPLVVPMAHVSVLMLAMSVNVRVAILVGILPPLTIV